MKIKYFIKSLFPIFCVFVLCGVLYSCGGSSSSSDDGGDTAAAANTITITAAATAPSASASLSEPLSRNASPRALTEVPLVGATCTCYTTEGEEVGTAITDENGNATIDVDLDALKGADDTGTTWSEYIILDFDGDIQLSGEVQVVEGVTTIIDMGTADMDTTLATQAIAAKIDGFTGWGQGDFSTAMANINPRCIYESAKTMWEDVSLEGEGLGGNSAMIKETVEGFIAAGANPMDYGYNNLGTLIRDLMAGDITDTSTIIQAAATANTSIDTVTFTSDFSTAVDAFQIVNDALAIQFSPNGTGMTNLANLVGRAATTSATEGSLCDGIIGGTVDPAVFMGPFLAATDVEAFKQTYYDPAVGTLDGLTVFGGLISSCMATCTAPPCCPEMTEKPGAYFGFMYGYAGDYGEVWDETAGFVDNALEGMFLAAGACTNENSYDCGIGMHGTVYNGGGGDWTQFMDSTGTAFDGGIFGTWGGYIGSSVANGWNPETADPTFYASAWGSNQEDFSDPTTGVAIQTCQDTLMAAGSYDFTSCFEEHDIGAYNQMDGFMATEYREEYVSQFGGFCGDTDCDSATETAATCPIDCGTNAQTTYCGDMVCNGTEAATTCAMDCSSGGSGSGATPPPSSPPPSSPPQGNSFTYMLTVNPGKTCNTIVAGNVVCTNLPLVLSCPNVSSLEISYSPGICTATINSTAAQACVSTPPISQPPSFTINLNNECVFDMIKQ